ncbi:hypothetical protein C8J57DRAFT_1510379 [Mycena rebaudengoi]|nr:hypothetical protein C8J57DRAFT_1510379 [Mycena rebaudengoi]
MCGRARVAGGFHIEGQVQQKIRLARPFFSHTTSLTRRQRCGHFKRKLPLAEYLLRIRPATNARVAFGSDIVLITRSDARASTRESRCARRRSMPARISLRGGAEHGGRGAAGRECTRPDAGAAPRDVRDGAGLDGRTGAGDEVPAAGAIPTYSVG